MFVWLFFCIGPFRPESEHGTWKSPHQKGETSINYRFLLLDVCFSGVHSFCAKDVNINISNKNDFPTFVIFEVLSCDVKTEDMLFFRVFLEMVHFTVKTLSLPWFMKIIRGGGSVYSTTDFFYPNLSWCRKQKRKFNNIIMINVGEPRKNKQYCVQHLIDFKRLFTPTLHIPCSFLAENFWSINSIVWFWRTKTVPYHSWDWYLYLRWVDFFW